VIDGVVVYESDAARVTALSSGVSATSLDKRRSVGRNSLPRIARR
jgi:hypothetical protein